MISIYALVLIRRGVEFVGDDSSWRSKIVAARPPVADTVSAVTPILGVRGISRAVVADCDDGQRYVVKGQQVKRALFADHVVGLMANLIEGPVPPVRLVEVPQALIIEGTLFEAFEAGIGHGSLFVKGCDDSTYERFPEDDGNRERFAAISVLFGWADCADRQYLQATSSPHHVWAIDFGSFFCGGDEWTLDSLACAADAQIDHLVASAAMVGPEDLRSAIARLARATDHEIARIVAVPPDDWGVSFEDRVGLAEYLARRRDHLLNGS